MRNNIKQVLANFQALGRDTVSLSDVMYYTRGVNYISEIVKTVKKIGYEIAVINGESFVILKRATRPATAKFYELPMHKLALGDLA